MKIHTVPHIYVLAVENGPSRHGFTTCFPFRVIFKKKKSFTLSCFRLQLLRLGFVPYEHNRCRLVENEVKFSECFAATYGDVKQCPYKVSKRRSRREYVVLFRAGSLGLMNDVGIRSPQRQAMHKLYKISDFLSFFFFFFCVVNERRTQR